MVLQNASNLYCNTIHNHAPIQKKIWFNFAQLTLGAPDTTHRTDNNINTDQYLNYEQSQW